MKGLLAFDSSDRASVDECLKNPYFDDVRSTKAEVKALKKMYLSCDSMTKEEFKDLDQATMRAIIRDQL